MVTNTFSQKSDARHIALARTLHARLFIDGSGRVFAVSGTAAHGPLARMFESASRVPNTAEAPRSFDFGVGTCQGELTPQVLRAIGHALRRWSADLEHELRLRGAKRRRLDAIMLQWCEVDRLAERHASLERLRRGSPTAASTQESPYFLDARTQSAWQALLDEIRGRHRLSPLAEWQGRLVCWLSGLSAARRFLTAAGEAAAAYPTAVRVDPIVALRTSLVERLARCNDQTDDAARREILRAIRALPPEAARDARLRAPRRGQSQAEACRRLIQGCDDYLDVEVYRLAIMIYAPLAALITADDCSVPFPTACFRYDERCDFFCTVHRRLYLLAQRIEHPAYPELLRTLECRPNSIPDRSFGRFVEILARGATPDDAVWACEQNLFFAMHKSQITVADARALSAEFASGHCPLKSGELYDVLENTRSYEALAAVRSWLAWVGSVSSATLTKPVRDTLVAALRRSILRALSTPARFARIAHLLKPLDSSAAASEIAPLLERIDAYRRHTVDHEQLPKSLRKLVEAEHTRSRELEHLTRRELRGELTPAAMARLSHLRTAMPATLDDDKLRRSAEELFLRLGTEALEREVRELTAEECRALFGDLHAAIPSGRLAPFVAWTDAMSAEQRRMFHDVVAARVDYGRPYKRYLADNQDWIKAAYARGIDIETWFDSEPEHVLIGGRRFEIEVTADLLDIFQMGTYFGTCLSQGGINEMSALTNAYDADKQVVFVYAVDDSGVRTVAGRQLLAVTADYKLLGYHFYFQRQCVGETRDAAIVHAMASFAGRLAARVGLEPANEGEAREIGDHFWYDDGAQEWPEATHRAWSLFKQQAPAEEQAAC